MYPINLLGKRENNNQAFLRNELELKKNTVMKIQMNKEKQREYLTFSLLLFSALLYLVFFGYLLYLRNHI